MSLKIVFMGTPDFSVPTLNSLIKSNHKILAVYTQPASRANRGQKLIPSKIEVLAKDKSLELRTPENLESDEEYDYFKNLNPDIVIVVAYGKIIPKRYFSLAKYGFINIHASLLPKWRGAAPIQRSIMNLDTHTGISIMKIVEELDAGPILQQKKISINENINCLDLMKELSNLGAREILDALNKIENGRAKFVEQKHSEATYAKKISKNECQIKWNGTAKNILAKINGLNPNPGAWFFYKNDRYKILKAEITSESGKAGETINNNLTIACKDYSLKITEIQKAGKNKQSAEQFLLGNKIKKGELIA